MRTKWEYKCVATADSAVEMETWLDRVGAKGWELVAVTQYGMYIFKRTVQED